MMATGALMRTTDPDLVPRKAVEYRRRRPAYNLALRMLGERAAAEDVVQDVFVRLFDSIRGFRGEAPFGAWLRRLVANATYWVVLKATVGEIDWAFTNTDNGTGVGFQHSFGETENAGTSWTPTQDGFTVPDANKTS